MVYSPFYPPPLSPVPCAVVFDSCWRPWTYLVWSISNAWFSTNSDSSQLDRAGRWGVLRASHFSGCSTYPSVTLQEDWYPNFLKLKPVDLVQTSSRRIMGCNKSNSGLQTADSWATIRSCSHRLVTWEPSRRNRRSVGPLGMEQLHPDIGIHYDTLLSGFHDAWIWFSLIFIGTSKEYHQPFLYASWLYRIRKKIATCWNMLNA